MKWWSYQYHHLHPAHARVPLTHMATLVCQHVEAAGEETESVQLSGVIGSRPASSPLPLLGVSRLRGVLERGDERSRRPAGAGDGCGVVVLLAPGGS